MDGRFANPEPIYGVVGHQFSLHASDFVPDGVTFNTDPAYGVEWNFGDGTNGSGAEVSHTWVHPAVFPLEMTYYPAGSSVQVSVTRALHVGVASGDGSSALVGAERSFVLARIPGPDLATRLCFFLIPNVQGNETPVESGFFDLESAAFVEATKAIHQLFRDVVLRIPSLSPELLTDGFYRVFPRDVLYYGTSDQILYRCADIREIMAREYKASIPESVPANIFRFFLDIREEDEGGNSALANQYRLADIILPQHNAFSIESAFGTPGLDFQALNLQPIDLTLYFVRTLVHEIAQIVSDYTAEWVANPNNLMTIVILNTEDLSLSVRFMWQLKIPGQDPETYVESIVWRHVTSQWSIDAFEQADPISTIQMYHDSLMKGMNVLSQKETDLLLEDGAHLNKKAVSLNNGIFEFDVASGVARPYGDISVDSDIPCYVATKGGGMVVLNTASYGGSPFMGNMQLLEGMFAPASEARNKYPGMTAPADAELIAKSDLGDVSAGGVTQTSIQEGSVRLKAFKTVFDEGLGGATLVAIEPEEITSLS